MKFVRAETRFETLDFKRDECTKDAIEFIAKSASMFAIKPRPNPVHIGWAWDKCDSKCGGILLIDARDFMGCHGFPNNVWGTGGEFDAFESRLERFGLPSAKFVRPFLRAGIESIGNILKERKIDIVPEKEVFAVETPAKDNGVRSCAARCLQRRLLSPRVEIATLKLV